MFYLKILLGIEVKKLTRKCPSCGLIILGGCTRTYPIMPCRLSFPIFFFIQMVNRFLILQMMGGCTNFGTKVQIV